jgi:uncharacterized protein (DUF1810 family)
MITPESKERKFADFSRFTERIMGKIKDGHGSGIDALKEMRIGKKSSHWMWYIFPQLNGLGNSEFAKFYGIINLKEAEEYISHPVCGKFLIYITKLVLSYLENGNTLQYVFGSIDKNKFLSSMTLFHYATVNSESKINDLFGECRRFSEKELNTQDKKTIEICEKELAQKGGKKIYF